MLRPRIILFSLGFFLPLGAQSSELDFNLSDEAFALSFAQAQSGGMQVDYGLLHQEDDINIATLGLHLVDNAASADAPFQVGLGGRLGYIDTDGPSGGMLAIGAWGRYNFPGANRFALAADVHFAPGVTSFGDVDNYLSYSVRGEYEVLRNGSLYLGYRRVEADFDVADNVDLDKGLHFGMRFTF